MTKNEMRDAMTAADTQEAKGAPLSIARDRGVEAVAQAMSVSPAKPLLDFHATFGRLPLGAMRRIRDTLALYRDGHDAWLEVEAAWHTAQDAIGNR